MMGRSTRVETGFHTCVMHSFLFKMADSTNADESPEKIESLQEESGDKELLDPEMNGDIGEEPVKGGQISASGSSKKKKKKKKGKGDGGSESVSPESLPGPAGVNLHNLRQLQTLQKSFELLKAGEPKAPKTTEEALRKKYQFWDTQPVPKLGGFLFRLAYSWIQRDNYQNNLICCFID